MNSLEFINKEIAIIKSKYKEHLKFNQTSLAIKDEKRLKHLQQIKEELEIMELIKNGWTSMETTLTGGLIMKFQNLKIDDWVKLWNKLEKILLKKTLEVKDE